MSDDIRGVQINLGSGQRKFSKPWINIDCQAHWRPDIVADGKSLPMFGENTVDTVVMHHVLEHFGCGEAEGVVKECYRILRTGGSLIVTVPNIPILFKAHARGDINTQILMTNLYGAYMGDEADRHKWGYTDMSLAEELSQCALWRHMESFDYRKIPGADIAQDWWILGIEATK